MKTGRKQAAVYEREEGPGSGPMALTLDFWPPKLWEICFCCLGHPARDLLLWQHELTGYQL